MLSVIAQQLLVLFGAKATMSSYFEHKEMEFEGTLITVKPAFNVFITMNPGCPRFDKFSRCWNTKRVNLTKNRPKSGTQILNCNPAVKLGRYAGRSELPDNLAAQFRPVAMMVRLDSPAAR